MFGTLVERFDVFMERAGELKAIQRQSGRWLVRESDDKTTPPPKPPYFTAPSADTPNTRALTPQFLWDTFVRTSDRRIYG